MLAFLIIAQLLLILSGPIPIRASNVSFGTTLNLSNDTIASGLPRMAASGKNVYVVWENNTAGNEDILFRASNNNGTSFGPVIKLSGTPNGDAINPQIAATGSNVYVVWEDNVTLNTSDTFFRASTNNGTSFGGVIDLCSSTSCGGVSGVTSSSVPDVAAAGNNVTVVWFSTTTSHKTPNNILAKTSNTNGSNLGNATAITLSTTAYPPTPSIAPPQTTALGKYVYVAWSDIANGSPQTFFARSINGGSTFGASLRISSATTGQNDVDQAIAASGNSVYVTWTNDTSTPTDNTMFSASTNNGASFGVALNLYKGNFSDMNPEIAASGNNVYVVWSNATITGQRVLYRSSNNNGASFNNILTISTAGGTAPQQMIAAFGANVYLTWAGNNPSNSVFFTSSSDNGTTFGTTQNLSPNTGSSLLPTPVIGAAGSNVYVAWQDDTQGDGDIFFRARVLILPPTANPTSFNSFRNQSVNVLLTGTDPQSLPLVFSIVTGPTHGTLGPITQLGPDTAQLTYTPALNYLGTDNFTFKANNGSLNSSPATVSITIIQQQPGTGGGPRYSR